MELEWMKANWLSLINSFLIIVIALYAIFSKQSCSESSENCKKKSCIRLLRRDFFYCGVVLFLCSIFIFTLSLAEKKDVVSHISFAGTLSSAILSIIAIFLTILSEAKNSEMKSRVTALIDKLEFVENKIEDNISNFNNIDIEVKKSFDKFKDLVEQQNKIILKKQDEIFNRVCDLKDETKGNKWKEEKGSISEGIKNE